MSSNEDWDVTSSIYGEESIVDEGIIDVPISLSQLVAIRRLDRSTPSAVLYPEFEYVALVEKEPPRIRAHFGYDKATEESEIDGEESGILSSVTLSFQFYPELFPMQDKSGWLTWLTDQTRAILEETRLSFSICEFIEHEGMKYFNMVHKIHRLGLAFCLFATEEDKAWPDATLLTGMDLHSQEKQIQEKKEGISKDKINKVIRSKWKKWVEYQCPICFCSDVIEKAIELPSCHHFFCSECISTYISTKVSDLNLYRTNPFVCPIVSCKTDFQVLPRSGDVPQKAAITSLVSNQDRVNIIAWQYNIDNPPCRLLTVCPMSRCRTRDMRKATRAQPGVVFCNECGKTICELCLKIIDGNHHCDDRQALKLCRKYLRASPEIQFKCEEKWHWIKEYANTRNDDLSAKSWVNEHASRCPNCSIPIERTEGCFHMHCTQCGTHYCYECGEELYGTSYFDGTHQCQFGEDDFENDFYGLHLLF